MPKSHWVPRLQIKYSLGYGRSRCAICGKLLIAENWDLHEPLFTRGDLSGVKWQSEIFHKFNSVGVCHGKCHHYATSETGQFMCAEKLIIRYGIRPIEEWMDELPFKSTVARSKAEFVLQKAYVGNY